MRIRLYLAALIGLSLLLAACKKENNPADNGGGGDTQNYFPSNLGTYYKFSVESEDSNGTTTQGQRSVTYTSIKNINGTDYTEEADTVFANNVYSTNIAHFRKTDTGVYYYLDTTGIGDVIPDSLMQYITIDNSLLEFAFPLQVGATWPVFKMTLNYIITLNLVNVNATVISKENITVAAQENKEAYKVRYVMTLTIPDPNNPLVPISRNYEAFCWVVKDIGAARWQGNAAVLGAFAGSGIDFGDSTTVVTQDLIQYNIK